LIIRSVVPLYKEFNMEQALKVREFTYIYVILSQVFIVIGSMNLPLPF